MTERDIKERDESRDMLKELYLVVIGDEAKGLDGMVHRQRQTLERIKELENKLEADYDLLWWNRTANGIWDVIKRPILYLITFALIASVASGKGVRGAWEYVLLKVGVK